MFTLKLWFLFKLGFLELAFELAGVAHRGVINGLMGVGVGMRGDTSGVRSYLRRLFATVESIEYPSLPFLCVLRDVYPDSGKMLKSWLVKPFLRNSSSLSARASSPSKNSFM